MTTDDSVVAGLQGASKRYGKSQALDGVNLQVRRGLARAG
jgi:ABC-type sugar transport system ATPase subunit